MKIKKKYLLQAAHEVGIDSNIRYVLDLSDKEYTEDEFYSAIEEVTFLDLSFKAIWDEGLRLQCEATNKKQTNMSTQKLTTKMLDEIVLNQFLVAAIYASTGNWHSTSEFANAIAVNDGYSVFTDLRKFIIAAEKLNKYMDNDTIVNVWNYAKELETLSENLTYPTKE